MDSLIVGLMIMLGVSGFFSILCAIEWILPSEVRKEPPRANFGDGWRVLREGRWIKEDK